MRKNISLLRWMQLCARGVLVVIFFSLIVVWVSPRAQSALAGVFFGKVPLLYHVTLAQSLYTMASEPRFGQAVPLYTNHHLSRTFFIQGDFKQALKYGYQELNLYPHHFTAYYIIGLTYGYMDMPEHAIYAFGEYLKWHPESWAARNDRAWIQFRVGDIDGAIETMNPARELYPTNPWVANTYCVLLINKARYTEARAHCTQAEESAKQFSANTWGEAYPGNDPRIYEEGLQAMRASIASNLELLNQKGE
jgi:tetratricopeptide (TPR) repeat protein